MADQGTGVTITFDTGFFGSITSLRYSGITRESVDITTAGTSGGKDYEPSDLYDLGELEVEILFAPGTSPHVLGSAAETCTVTWADSGTTTWASSAFMTNFAPGFGEVTDRVRASATLKLSGDITIT